MEPAWQLPLAAGDAPPVSFQAKSHDRKLSPVILKKAKPRPRPFALGPFVSSTYVSIGATCPDTCVWKNNGCYVDTLYGYTPVRALEERALSWSWGALETTLAEADIINAAFPRGVPRDGWRGNGRDLRLHVSGDVSCKKGADALGRAAQQWELRGGGRVWTYTHRWRDIPIGFWRDTISVIASVETVQDVKEALRAGYAAAITLVAFPDNKMFAIPGLEDYRIMPCPAETQGKTCAQCRLCLQSGWLRKQKLVIGFALHGKHLALAKRRLRVLQGDTFDSLPLKLLPT